MREPRISLTAGRTGTGKSHYAGWELEQYAMQSVKNPFIVLDMKPLNHIGLAALPGAKAIIVKKNTPRLNWKRLIQENPRLVVVKGKGVELETIIAIYTRIMQICYNNYAGQHVLLEEAHNFAGLHDTIEPVKQLVLEGRGAGISCQFVTPHIQDFSKTVYREAELIIGKTITDQDIQYFKGTVPDYENLNAQLQKYDFIKRTQEGQTSIVRAGERITRHYG